MKDINKGLGYIALAAICIVIVYFTKAVAPVIILAVLGFAIISE